MQLCFRMKKQCQCLSQNKLNMKSMKHQASGLLTYMQYFQKILRRAPAMNLQKHCFIPCTKCTIIFVLLFEVLSIKSKSLESEQRLESGLAKMDPELQLLSLFQQKCLLPLLKGRKQLAAANLSFFAKFKTFSIVQIIRASQMHE